MPPAPYQLVKKRCKGGYSRDSKGGSMCVPKPGYTPKARAASTRPRDKLGRFVTENTPLSQYASYKKGTFPGVKLPAGFQFKKPATKAAAPTLTQQQRESLMDLAHKVSDLIEELDD
jgi:hypothetical protein